MQIYFTGVPWETITVWIGLKTHCEPITDNVFGGDLRQILSRYNEDVNENAFSLSSLRYMQFNEVMLLQLIKHVNLTILLLQCEQDNRNGAHAIYSPNLINKFWLIYQIANTLWMFLKCDKWQIYFR